MPDQLRHDDLMDPGSLQVSEEVRGVVFRYLEGSPVPGAALGLYLAWLDFCLLNNLDPEKLGDQLGDLHGIH